MLADFKNHITDNFPELKDAPFLLALSGGIDSSVLFDLFLKLDYSFDVAHCNFKLRGEESDEDSNFVMKLTKKNNKKIFIKEFKTKKHSKKNNISIQLAARSLRYKWFSKLLKKENYLYLVTAHNLNDQLETYLINTSRVTGLKGILGIPSNNQNIVRPLLLFKRDQILKYAIKSTLSWREDSSNSKDDYLRNSIRNNLISEWLNIEPMLLNNFSRTLNNLTLASSALNNIVSKFKDESFIKMDYGYSISIKELLKLIPSEYYLFEIFGPYGFTNTIDVISLLKTQSGKNLISKTHRLIKGRGLVFLTTIKSELKEQYSWDCKRSIKKPINLKIILKSKLSNNFISLNKELLKFPLTIRRWNKGDYFHPFGMNGKKKISKYFKDEKFNLIQKEQQWLLCSDENIVWVIGKRADRRFLANNECSNKIVIQCL